MMKSAVTSFRRKSHDKHKTLCEKLYEKYLQKPLTGYCPYENRKEH